jgi:hypothetical protein
LTLLDGHGDERPGPPASAAQPTTTASGGLELVLACGGQTRSRLKPSADRAP